MPCPVCQNLQPDTLTGLKANQYATLFLDASRLAQSAQSNSCSECRLLSDVIGTRHEGWITDSHQWRSIRLRLARGKPIQLRCDPHDTEEFTDVQIYRPPSEQDNTRNLDLPDVIGSAPDIPQFSGSWDSISTIKAWNLECSTTHDLCSIDKNGQLPTRLLAVNDENPCLVETKGMNSAAYVALSYCWGNPDKHPVVKTLKYNYSQHRTGVNFESLPAALRDAIYLTRVLGFNYIWIDALCIVQDDDADWEREAATMCSVYSQAALTIVANRSDGTASSIFGIQKFHHYDVVFYKNTSIRVRNNILNNHEVNPVIPLGPDPDPISQRAWTLQEAVLSHRAVHFTTDELRWECNTCRYCQCGQYFKRFPLRYDPEELEYEGYRTWRLNDFFPAESPEAAYLMWQNMLTSYTTRMLTKEQDRLVALSGLAQRFSAALEDKFNRKDVYLAGLWKGALPEMLLWFIELRKFSVLRKNRHERPTTWRAPSWSWASMEAAVNNIRVQGLQSQMEVIDARLVLLDDDPFGQVKSGLLHVRARMLHGIRFVHDPQQTFTSRFPIIRYRGLDLRVDNSYIDDDRDSETDKYLTDPTLRLSLLVIGFSRRSDLHECLVLEPVPNNPANYQRLGIVRLGQHLREPKEHAIAIENAPIVEVTLV